MNILKDDEYKTIDRSPRGRLIYLTIVAVIEQLDNISVLFESLQGANFSKDSFTCTRGVLLKEFVLNNFDCDELLRMVQGLRQVNLRSISLAESSHESVFSIKNRLGHSLSCELQSHLSSLSFLLVTGEAAAIGFSETIFFFMDLTCGLLFCHLEISNVFCREGLSVIEGDFIYDFFYKFIIILYNLYY